ncbi:MAG: guanylate cyclase, partial [Cyanobacteria bacterium P01_H01_bin.15]
MTATSPPSQSPFEPLKPQIRGERQGRQDELAQPVLALKKLVANLNREQNKIQNLLGSLSFALRSFNNLNQFLELTPLMVARVTDADGGVLIMVRGDGQLELGQLHSPSMVLARRVKQEIINNLNNLPSQPGINASELDRLDQGLRQSFGKNLQWFGTPILVNNQEQGRLYIFSQDLAYAWSQTRRRLAQLVADQTAVAIANHQMTVELRAKERQDRELEIASEIQLRLLPRQCPTIVGVDLAAHCRTANRVGGDYYDFIPTNYDQIRPPENTADVETEQGVPWSIV